MNAELQSMESAPMDGTPVLLKFKDDLREYSADDYWYETWAGLYFVGRNRGDKMDWSFAAPVGHGGISSLWLEGWQPLPTNPT